MGKARVSSFVIVLALCVSAFAVGAILRQLIHRYEPSPLQKQEIAKQQRLFNDRMVTFVHTVHVVVATPHKQKKAFDAALLDVEKAYTALGSNWMTKDDERRFAAASKILPVLRAIHNVTLTKNDAYRI